MPPSTHVNQTVETNASITHTAQRTTFPVRQQQFQARMSSLNIPLNGTPHSINTVVQRVEAGGQHPVQRKEDFEYLQRTIGNRAVIQLLDRMKAAETADIHKTAAAGVQGTGGQLPHLDKIQQSFGQHDISSVQAFTGSKAATASKAIGAEAYTTGNKIAFASPSPDLHTIAHEATHVLQQRAGVQLHGGVGKVGDSYERQADAVADKVVKGQSAERLINQPHGTTRTALQRQLSEGEKEEFLAKNKNLEKAKLTSDELALIIQNSMGLDDANTRLIRIIGTNSAITKRQGKSEYEEELAELVIERRDLLATLGEALKTAIPSLLGVLLRNFPMDAWIYIMMGNSPAPLMAYIQALQLRAEMIHLPLGGITDVFSADESNKEKLQVASDRLNAYFNDNVGINIRSNKPLVVVDYTSSGNSLVLAVTLLKSWLEQEQDSRDVEFFGFTSAGSTATTVLAEQREHSGVIATAHGEMEKVFIRMLGDKSYKMALLLRGPASMEMSKLLNAQDGVDVIEHHPEFYLRLLTLMKKELI